jgi:YkoY family integral membrane protein
MLFGQTFEAHDLVIIALLIVLEGVLSIDNALVLGILAKRLPKHQQQKALTYGLIGAFVFRIIAIATATILLKWTIFKLLGGGYLIYIAVKHFFFDAHDPEKEKIKLDASGNPILVDEETEGRLPPDEEVREAAARAHVPAKVIEPVVRRPMAKFWPTVFVIEMTDIAFAVDSIVAAIGVVGPPPADAPVGAAHPKLWVVVIGGMLGVVLMRFAAVLFIKLLDRFPRFETAAYLLVIVIGMKLVADWTFNSEAHPHRLNFHNWRGPEFWIFWVAMAACFAIGFVPKRNPAHRSDALPPAPEAAPTRGDA